MVVRPDPASFWDGVWAWADLAGLLLPPDERDERPPVPHQVCDNCPICQTAALLDQVDPQVVAELTEVVRGLVSGLASALASAAEQRMPGGGDDADPGVSDASRPAPDVDRGQRGSSGRAAIGDSPDQAI